MNTQLKILIFTLAVTGFYTYVGQIVPQMESHPPKSTEIASDLDAQGLADAGRAVFFGKGTCALCHTVGGEGGRCPDLDGVGARAARRVENLSASEYLAQSLYEPRAYVVDGFTPTMPTINRPPIGLSDAEIVAVVAFLESQGGEVSVTPQTVFQWAGAAASTTTASSPPSGMAEGPMPVEAILARYGCGACHSFDGPQRLLGPSLWNVGNRRSKAEILDSIVEPDALLTEGDPPYPPGLMFATLSSSGFYSDLSLAELNSLAEHLASLKGGEGE